MIWGVVPQSNLSYTIIVSRCYNNDLGVVPQSDLSSTIIVHWCYNDLNFSPMTDSLFHEKTLPYGHRRQRLKMYNR